MKHIFMILMVAVAFVQCGLLVSREVVKCGTREHYAEWLEALNQMPHFKKLIYFDKIHAAIHKAKNDMLANLSSTAEHNRGPQAFHELDLYGKKMSQEFNCTDGMSWVEQMTQTGIAFNCGGKPCEAKK